MGEEGGRVLPSETNAGTSFTAVIKEKWRPKPRQAKAAKKGCSDPGNVEPWTLCLRGEILPIPLHRPQVAIELCIAKLIVEMQSQLFSRNQAMGSNCSHLKALNFVLLVKAAKPD